MATFSTGAIAAGTLPVPTSPIGGPSAIAAAVETTSPMLQNFHSSFAARPYWNRSASASKASSSPARNLSITVRSTIDQHRQLRLVVRPDRLTSQPGAQTSSAYREATQAAAEPVARARPIRHDAAVRQRHERSHSGRMAQVPAPPTNMRVARPSRKAQQPGDVFAVQLPDLTYRFGRVIRTDATWTLAQDAGPAILIYLYTTGSNDAGSPGRDELRPGALLLPPIMTNRLPGRGAISRPSGTYRSISTTFLLGTASSAPPEAPTSMTTAGLCRAPSNRSATSAYTVSAPSTTRSATRSSSPGHRTDASGPGPHIG